METVAKKPDFLVFPNPDNPLEIKIPIFEGPLDLLLHLIRKKELDISQVPLSELTSSYLAYLDYLEAINLEYAGEFLETAATLIWIKSKHLLPKPSFEEEIEADPEEQLRRQLIEYEKYKQAAFLLSCSEMLGRDVFVRPEIEAAVEEESATPVPVFEEVSLYGLMEAFRRVMERPQKTIHIVETESYRLEDRIEAIIRKFYTKPQYEFEEFFLLEDQSRMLIIVIFMAILEMVKLGMIRVKQKSHFAPIYCYVSDEFHQNVAKWYEQHQLVKELNIA